MESSIRKIFLNNIELLEVSDKIVFYIRTQNYDLALRSVSHMISIMEDYLPTLFEKDKYFNEEEPLFDKNMVMDFLQDLLDAQQNKDYVLLADIYELSLSSLLINLQGLIMKKEGFTFNPEVYQNKLEYLSGIYPDLAQQFAKNPDPDFLCSKGYYIERTSCGLMTLASEDNKGKYYLHSNYKVMQEAFTLASSWYREDITEYIVYGMGLGYHIRELMKLDESIKIEIYESDLTILSIATAYTDIKGLLSNPNIILHYDPDFKKLMKRLGSLNNETQLVMHYPSLRSIKNVSIKDQLENIFIQQSSITNQIKMMNANFIENTKNYDALVDELMGSFEGRDLYIVAAGPSLDKNFHRLKEVNKDSIILATGTVFKKLLKEGIRPDYFIVTDANTRVYKQIEGLEYEKIPMLFLSTAYKGFAQKYNGKKYIIFQEKYTKAEEFAENKGKLLIQTGGSVSTTALDLGITFGCKRIIFLGLDLAFTDNFVHAKDTSRRELADTADLREVEDINGKMVYTSKSLDIYRRWIEKRIETVKDIEFIDATEGGAKIKGMKIISLQEMINLQNG